MTDEGSRRPRSVRLECERANDRRNIHALPEARARLQAGRFLAEHRSDSTIDGASRGALADA